jgi:PAS domain S-box-containing protein
MPGPLSRLSAPARYFAAVACVALAILVRWLLGPVLGRSLPYSLQFVAVLAAARYLGLGPAIGGLILGTVPIFYTAAFHPRTLSIGQPRFWIVMAGIYGFCIFLIRVLDRQRKMRMEVETASRLAGERLEQLSIEVAQRAREQRLSAQLRAIVESSEDAILSKDLNGVILSWNHGAEQIYGFVADEAIGKTIEIVLPLDRVHEESDILEGIRRGRRIKHFETVRLRKDGRAIHVSLTISPIRDAQGNIVGASHIARDITERRQLEEQLRQTQKLESLGVLAGGLAHDFNNLLTGVMGNASLAMEELSPSSPACQHVSEVVSATERAATLVRQMLAYAGKGRFVVQQLNLAEQVSQILPLVRTSMPHTVQLELRLAENLPPIEGDAAQMQQIIMNLAINAAEAVGDNPGAVTIAVFARETDSERQVVLEVNDTGCGMDDATRVRIFDPFFTTKFTGRGLGLAAVLGIIRGHRGVISVESEPGKGSTFTVVLPAARERDSGGPPEPELQLRGYGHVLVVDDEELVRNMAQFTLERCGYTVETAADGLAALEMFEARPDVFDAVLLDLMIPSSMTEEILERLHSIRPETRVVLSSGYTEAEAQQRFQSYGLVGFLQKPYTATVLARKIKHAFNPALRAYVASSPDSPVRSSHS